MPQRYKFRLMVLGAFEYKASLRPNQQLQFTCDFSNANVLTKANGYITLERKCCPNFSFYLREEAGSLIQLSMFRKVGASRASFKLRKFPRSEREKMEMEMMTTRKRKKTQSRMKMEMKTRMRMRMKKSKTSG